MHENNMKLINIILSLVIIFLTVFITHRFIPSLAWAGVIVIATYPLYRRWRKLFGKHQNLSAFLFTLILALILFLPLSWLVHVLVKEMQIFVSYLQAINRHGGEAPDIIRELPFVGKTLVSYWDVNLAEPGHLKRAITNLHVAITPVSYYVKQISINLAHRGIQIGFTLLCLFFFYRDSAALFNTVNQMGENCLGQRWYRYADKLPLALRGTVNGTIVVGMGVGLLMGICYALVGFPAPTLLGFMTAIAAMIPFVVPLVFMIQSFVLWCNGALIGAVVVLIWGTLVMFVADHFVKPVLIGGAIQLPFLAVLFGILGGVETLGLLGLFVGPIIMVLFITLVNESKELNIAH